MMKKLFKCLIRPAIQRAGFDIIKLRKKESGFVYPPDFSAENIEICEIVKPYTMTSQKE